MKNKHIKTKFKFERMKMEEIKNKLPKEFKAEIYKKASFNKMKDVLLKLK